jgi:hypothetical protein
MTTISRSRLLIGSLLSLAAVTIGSCKGATGPEGEAGSPGISSLQFAQLQGNVQPVQGSSNGILNLRVECPAGTKAIAGGFSASGDGSQFVSAFQSYPISPTAWEISVHNGYSAAIPVSAFATCVVVQ